MTVFNGGSGNPINYLLSRDNIAMVQTMNRLQPVKQTNQSVGVGSHFVTKRITRGAQSAAQKYNPNICSNGKPVYALCPQGPSPCVDPGYSICGGPCQGVMDTCGILVNPTRG